MTTKSPDWERRCAALWDEFDSYEHAKFRGAMSALVAELPQGDATAYFECASAHDATDQGEEAVALYERALEAGLRGERRRQAVIQWASTLRALGRPERAVDLLFREREEASDELDDAVTAFLALALVDSGRERDAAALALGALARHLPRYTRSLTLYAEELTPHAPQSRAPCLDPRPAED